MKADSQANIVPFRSSNSTLRYRTVAKSSTPKTSVWTRLRDSFYKLMLPGSEPKIVQKQKPNGDEYYHVYDPTTGNSKTFGSELETRIWLDRRFYENSRNW
jgi:hypothetical protein